MSRHLARFALFGGILLVCLIAFNPHARDLPTTGWDKLNHVLAFSALGFTAWWAYPTVRWRSFAALLAFGVLIELVQSQMPAHKAEAADLLADVVGLGLAASAAHLVRRRGA